MFGLELEQIIISGGVLIVALIAFAETAFLIGTILPGDSLLLLAGILAAQGHLPVEWLIPALIVAAAAADNVAYSIGRRAGPRIFRKQDGILFRQEYVEQAEKFYNRHGGKTVILARFVPVVRSFAPVIAGVGKMDRGRYLMFNLVGAILWATSITMLGFLFGSTIPEIGDYMHYVLAAAVGFTLAVMTFHLLRDPKSRALIWQRVKLVIRNLSLNKKIG